METKYTQTSLQLQLIEDAEQVRLSLTDGSIAILDFENAEPAAVRVVGFNSRHGKEEVVAAFVERETPSFGSELAALNALVNSHERQVYEKTKLLRIEARKLLMLGHTLRSAKKARSTLQGTSPSF
jgi:hypothetical protein